jgi:hypothetical protein
MLFSGCTLSNALNLLPSHITRHLRILRQPLQITYTLFIVSLILWSSLLFTTFLLLNPQPCSITSVLTALADQTSRTAFTALVLFSVRPPIHNTGERAVVLLFIAMRAIIGAVVVGFTRSTFMPVCLPSADTGDHGLAPGITQLCFDGVLMSVSVVRAWVGWRARRGSQAGGLVAVVVAAMAWSISTAPFQLRAGSIFVRLVPTIVTLSILLALLKAYPEALFKVEDNGEEGTVGDRGMQRLASNASQPPQQVYRQNTDVESLNKPAFTSRGQSQSNSGLFRNVIGQPIVHPGTMVAWASEGSIPPSRPSSSMVETRFPSQAGGKASISGPMLSGGVMAAGSGGGSRRKNSSFSSASAQENRRTTRVPSVSETPRTISSFAGLPTPTFAPGHQRYNSQSSMRRKPMIPARMSTVQNTRGLPEGTLQQQYPIPPSPPQPQQHTGYRMSSNTYYTEDDDATTRYTVFSNGFSLAPAPRNIPASEDIGNQRVLLVHSIEYDNPALVQSLVTGGLDEKAAYTTGRFTPPTNGVMRRSPSAATLAVHREEDLNESPILPGSSNGGLTPVLTRKHPVPNRSSRVLFPSDSPSHSRNHSTSSKKSSRSSRSILSTRISPPPPPPDQPLPPPPPPQEKTRKPAPAPIKIMNSGGGGMLGIPMSAVNNPTIPVPPTPYETAKAWIASMAPVRKNSGPVLVNIHSRKASSARTASISTLDQEVAAPPTVPPLVITRKPSVSTVSKTEAESIVIQLRKSLDDENESAPSLTTSSPQRRQSGFALPRGNGEEDDDDVFNTLSSYSSSSAGFSDSVIISDFEDSIELENLHVRQQQLPQHFKLGDKIPTFYSSRPANQGYGGRRKPPPVPLGMVPLRQRFMRPPPPPPPPRRQSSRASIIPESVIIEAAPNTAEKQLRARLTLLATKQEQQEQRRSDIGVLLQQLEAEASQQETQWKGMRQTLVLRDSMISPGSDFTDLTELESRRQSTRRSSLARLQLALERRMSVALTTATTDTTVTSVGGWQKQLAEAQIAYIQQAPMLNRRAEMLEKELQELEEELIEPLQPTVYVNPTLEISPTAIGASDEDEAEIFLSLGLFPAPPTPARLWSPPTFVPPAHSSHLWSGFAQCSAAALPAAISVRPKKRFDPNPLALSTSRLWSKSRELRVLPHEGLWRDPTRPKSIIRRRSSAASKKHRVTFVEDPPLPTEMVETTGLFGKLGNFKLWGGKPTTTTTTKRAVPVDTVTQRYTVKALPKLPVMVSKQQSRQIPRLWTKPRRRSVMMMSRSMLWPSGPGISMVQLAEPTPRGSRARVHEEAISTATLWTAAAAPASLWQKQSALWPHGEFISAAREGLWGSRKLTQQMKAPQRQKKRYQGGATPSFVAGDVSLWRAGDVAQAVVGKGLLWVGVAAESDARDAESDAREAESGARDAESGARDAESDAPRSTQAAGAEAVPASSVKVINRALSRRSVRVISQTIEKPSASGITIVIKVGRRVFTAIVASEFESAISGASPSASSSSSESSTKSGS